MRSTIINDGAATIFTHTNNSYFFVLYTNGLQRVPRVEETCLESLTEKYRSYDKCGVESHGQMFSRLP